MDEYEINKTVREIRQTDYNARQHPEWIGTRHKLSKEIQETQGKIEVFA